MRCISYPREIDVTCCCVYLWHSAARRGAAQQGGRSMLMFARRRTNSNNNAARAAAAAVRRQLFIDGYDMWRAVARPPTDLITVPSPPTSVTAEKLHQNTVRPQTDPEGAPRWTDPDGIEYNIGCVSRCSPPATGHKSPVSFVRSQARCAVRLRSTPATYAVLLHVHHHHHHLFRSNK